MITYEHGLAMARNMKAYDSDIRVAIRQVQRDRYGVVALRFSNLGQDLKIEILDEPYDENVRVFPGE